MLTCEEWGTWKAIKTCHCRWWCCLMADGNSSASGLTNGLSEAIMKQSLTVLWAAMRSLWIMKHWNGVRDKTEEWSLLTSETGREDTVSQWPLNANEVGPRIVSLQHIQSHFVSEQMVWWRPDALSTADVNSWLLIHRINLVQELFSGLTLIWKAKSCKLIWSCAIFR